MGLGRLAEPHVAQPYQLIARFDVLDVFLDGVPKVVAREGRRRVEKTLLADVVARAAPLRVDDLSDPSVPESSRVVLGARGWRSAVLVPLPSRERVFGAVTLGATRRAAFDDRDVESAAELVRPLASAIEQRRLVDESRRRAEELGA